MTAPAKKRQARPDGQRRQGSRIEKRPARRQVAPQLPRVICFGEILWDFLPAGLFPGGAPFNVAYHLHQHGVAVDVASAVGTDLLGDELMRRLGDWGVPTRGIAQHPVLPTGYVRAQIGPGGDAHYEITRHVAWDRIAATPTLLRLAKNANAFIFGSLAQRTVHNRQACERWLGALPLAALRVFDVNLRPPHDSLPLVRKLARHANVLKLNCQEAAQLAGIRFKAGLEERCARVLAHELGCPAVLITGGETGAGLLRGGKWRWERGRKVKVADTIGAGDSFLASFVANQLAGLGDEETLVRACRLGEWVATQRGATPAYTAATPR